MNYGFKFLTDTFFSREKLALVPDLEGSSGNDLLIGTNDADTFVTEGGNFDRVFGRGGLDAYDLSAIFRNEKRDVTYIGDFEAGETIIGVYQDDIRFTHSTDSAVIQVYNSGDITILNGITDANDVVMDVRNRAPEFDALPDQTVSEDDILVFPLHWYVQDADGDQLEFYSVDYPTLSALQFQDGNLIFKPEIEFDWLAEGQTVEFELVVGVRDNQGGSDTASLAITVVGDNDAPKLASREPHEAVNYEDLRVDLTALASDADIDDSADTLTFEVIVQPESGNAYIEGGVLVYEPDPTIVVEERQIVTVSATDRHGASVVKEIKIDVYSMENPGAVVSGSNGGDQAGWSSAIVGDLNGDGVDDFVFSAPAGDFAGHSGNGTAYVVFGSDVGIDPYLSVDELDGTNGFVIGSSDRFADFGSSVANAGDLNNDGIDDLFIGAEDDGIAHVIYGSSDGFDAQIDVTQLDGSNGTTITGIGGVAKNGQNGSGGGDINGDGVDDLVIGAVETFSSDPSSVYVIYGETGGLGAEFGVDDLDGSNGFTIRENAAQMGIELGQGVSIAGDVNGDGINDLVITAPELENGTTFVVYGSTEGFDANFDLTEMTPDQGYSIAGLDFDGRLGVSVSSGGDMNGDGIDDIVLGAHFAGTAGRTYVIFGREGTGLGDVDIGDLSGSNGFVIYGDETYSQSGYSVSLNGDISGDGIDDLVIGAPKSGEYPRDDSGAAYIIYGSDEGFSSSINLSLLRAKNGMVIVGAGEDDRVGFSVSNGGDINGDGVDDLLIAGYNAEADGSRAGEIYVIYGGEENLDRVDAIDGINNGTVDLHHFYFDL
ncbi:Ig-like domain-containing protein [Celeribacter litoreus]|uniref:Ig-like domain-containing protein n=1 Tax=Celeribacter litoreus TaxID=2876714 RepID=UPI001CC911AE|nr:integrin alpha [Celeribacter litoreus]MCA0042623.1 integrin alpha [Celeribacter litoreus]